MPKVMPLTLQRERSQTRQSTDETPLKIFF